MAKKRNAGRLPVYDPRATDARLSVDLLAALEEKLNLAELIELEKQLRKSDHEIRRKTCNETFELTILIAFRVLNDRFGFGRERRARFWDTVKSYADDVIAGRVKLEELRRMSEDEGFKIEWEGEDG